MIDVCSIPHWQHLVIIFASQITFMGFEAWLGKTKTVKANSTLELIFNLAVKLFNKPKGE